MNTNTPMQPVAPSPADVYLESLSAHERHAYEIARSHLQSMFSLKKSNGFVKWSKCTPTVVTATTTGHSTNVGI